MDNHMMIMKTEPMLALRLSLPQGI